MGHYEELNLTAEEGGKYDVFWMNSVSFKHSNECTEGGPHLPHYLDGGYTTPSSGRVKYACPGLDLPALGAEVVDLHRGNSLSTAHVMWRLPHSTANDGVGTHIAEFKHWM